MHQSCLREDQNQNQILEKKSSDTIQQQNFQVEEEEILDDQGTFNINVPNLMVKSKYSVEVNQIRQQNENTTEDFFSTLQDDIFEKDQQKQLKNKQKPNFKQKQQLIKNSYFKRYQQNKKTQLVSTFQEKVFSNKIRKKSLSLSPLRRQPQKNQNLSQSNICSDDLNNKAHQQFSHQQNEQKEKFCGIFQNNRELCQSEYKFHDSQQSQKFSLQQNDYAITRLYTNSSSNNYIISPKLNEKQIVDNQGDLISQSQNTNTCMQHLSQRELILEEENKKISLGKKIILKALNCKKRKENSQDLTEMVSLEQKFLEEQVVKNMDIYEQLAAIQLVGYSSKYAEHRLTKGQQKVKNLNYFEKQFDILDSLDLQSKYVLKFIQKCSFNNDLNIIDQRILSSLNSTSKKP
ncbi:hypothetical protein ABPG73_007193 [Tetrahymena malaccensis]